MNLHDLLTTEEFINYSFIMQQRNNHDHIFTTTAGTLPKKLSTYFLERIAGNSKNDYRCSHCEAFIDTYGGLAVVGKDGWLESPFWNIEDAPTVLENSVSMMLSVISQSSITGIFTSPETIVAPPGHLGSYLAFGTYWCADDTTRPKEVGQELVEKKFLMLHSAVNLVSLENTQKTLNCIVKTPKFRTEAGQTVWRFYQLHKRYVSTLQRLRVNFIWSAAASMSFKYVLQMHALATHISTKEITEETVDTLLTMLAMPGYHRPR